jgi:type IV pilus assembly protein PilA
MYKESSMMLQVLLRRLKDAHATEVEGEGIAVGGFTLIELMVVLLIIAILLAIAIPTFLGVTSTAGDRGAQSDLTNALIEAKALYQVNQAYSNQGLAYTSGAFQSQAPELFWQTTSCSAAGSSSNCVSFAVGDSASAGDGQGVALAVWSAKTNTCWYAVDLEITPLSLTLDTNAFIGQTNSKNTTGIGGTLPTAGVFYGKNTATGAICQASKALDPTNAAGWATSYAKATTVN